MSVESHGSKGVSDDEFSAYIFVALPPERAREIEGMAVEDEELTAEIELFRILFGRDIDRTRPAARAERR